MIITININQHFHNMKIPNVNKISNNKKNMHNNEHAYNLALMYSKTTCIFKSKHENECHDNIQGVMNAKRVSATRMELIYLKHNNENALHIVYTIYKTINNMHNNEHELYLALIEFKTT